MYNSDTELIFPPRVIPALRGLRKAGWDKLLDEVIASGDGSPEEAGFVLMMARLDGCASCNADSFRAMHGCTQCAMQTIRRYHGADKSLAALHHKSQTEVEKFLKGKK